MNNLLSLEEVRRFLALEEEKVHQLVRQGRLHAYKIGGTYLRFRKEEILSLKQELAPSRKTGLQVPWFVRLREFWRFNNFYIVSLAVLAALFFFLVRP